MRKSELEKYIKKTSEVARTVMRNRGSILEFAADIENELTNIITWCFYPAQYSTKLLINELLDENGIIFKSIILRKLDFCDKINILKEVILAKKPDIWDSYHQIIKNIIRHLDEVREFRNLMAHAPSDMSEKYLKSINLVTFKRTEEFQVLEYKKGGLKKHRINQNKIESEIWKCIRTQLELQQLFALINGDHQTYKDHEELVTLTNTICRTSTKS